MNYKISVKSETVKLAALSAGLTNPTRLPFTCHISLIEIITSEKQYL